MTDKELNQLMTTHDAIMQLELAGAQYLADLLRELLLLDEYPKEQLEKAKVL